MTGQHQIAPTDMTQYRDDPIINQQPIQQPVQYYQQPVQYQQPALQQNNSSWTNNPQAQPQQSNPISQDKFFKRIVNKVEQVPEPIVQEVPVSVDPVEEKVSFLTVHNGGSEMDNEQNIIKFFDQQYQADSVIRNISHKTSIEKLSETVNIEENDVFLYPYSAFDFTIDMAYLS